MTFDEWLDAQITAATSPVGMTNEEWLRAAFMAGAAAEREACLKAIDEADNCECGVPCDCFGAGAAKWAIKARSNAEVTGGPLSARPVDCRVRGEKSALAGRQEKGQE